MGSSLGSRAIVQVRDAVVGAVLGLLVASCATAGHPDPGIRGINRAAIIAYADRYWLRYNTAFRSYYPNDCTNFVSQAWYARSETGQIDPKTLQVISDSNVLLDVPNQWIPEATNWTLAQGFVDYQNGPGVGNLVNIPMNNPGRAPNGGVWSRLLTNDTPASGADVVVFRTGTAGTSTYWSHAALMVDSVQVGTHTDSVTGTRVTYDAWVDRIDSHTASRYREPWNIGFRVEQKTLDAQKLAAHKNNWDTQIVAL